MKVLIAHPGKQHAFKLAEALYNEGELYAFVTTVYNKPHTLTNFMLNLLPKKNREKAVRRRNDVLPNDVVVVMHELLGLVVTLATKFSILRNLYPFLNNYLNDCFGKSVARYAIKHKVDAVISFDNNSTALFEYLKKNAPNIVRILDVSIASRFYLKDIYEKDYSLNNEKSLFEEQKILWDSNYLERIKQEFALSQFFLAGSSFVKESLIYSGVEEEKINVVHYGVNTNAFFPCTEKREDDFLNLIYVGGISYRKGLHHLLSVVSTLEDNKIKLVVVGDYNKESDIYIKYSCFSNITFRGFLTHDKLAYEYQKADAFVLASLGEGMAMVGLEAMSSGLPVICSTNTGLLDVVNNENGFTFQAGNDNELREVLLYVKDNKQDLQKMGLAARNMAQNYTWDSYSKNVIETIHSWVGKGVVA